MFDSITALTEQIFENPLQAFVTVALIVVVYLYINKKKENVELTQKLNEQKQQFYLDLFLFLNQVLRSQIDVGEKEHMDRLLGIDSKLKLYASDAVVKAWADFWRVIFLKLPKDQYVVAMFKAYSYLQLAIRKDIGSSSKWTTTLRWYDFPRSTANDLEEYLQPSERVFRTTEMQQLHQELTGATEEGKNG